METVNLRIIFYSSLFNTMFQCNPKCRLIKSPVEFFPVRSNRSMGFSFPYLLFFRFSICFHDYRHVHDAHVLGYGMMMCQFHC